MALLRMLDNLVSGIFAFLKMLGIFALLLIGLFGPILVIFYPYRLIRALLRSRGANEIDAALFWRWVRKTLWQTFLLFLLLLFPSFFVWGQLGRVTGWSFFYLPFYASGMIDWILFEGKFPEWGQINGSLTILLSMPSYIFLACFQDMNPLEYDNFVIEMLERCHSSADRLIFDYQSDDGYEWQSTIRYLEARRNNINIGFCRVGKIINKIDAKTLECFNKSYLECCPHIAIFLSKSEYERINESNGSLIHTVQIIADIVCQAAFAFIAQNDKSYNGVDAYDFSMVKELWMQYVGDLEGEWCWEYVTEKDPMSGREVKHVKLKVLPPNWTPDACHA